MPLGQSSGANWTGSDWWSAVLNQLLTLALDEAQGLSTFVSVLAVPWDDRFSLQMVRSQPGIPEPYVEEMYIVWQSIREGSKLPFSFVVSTPGLFGGLCYPSVVYPTSSDTGQSVAASMLAIAADRLVSGLLSALPVLCEPDVLSCEAEPLIEDEPNRYSSKTVVVKFTEFGIRHVIGVPLVVKWRESSDPFLDGIGFLQKAHISERHAVQAVQMGELVKAVRDISKREIHIHITPDMVRARVFPPEE